MLASYSIRLLIIATVFALATGVISQDQPTRTQTVFAATSLTDVFEEMKDGFEELNPGVEILLNFASSSTLAAQIIAGAPADIFASANETQMEHAVVDGRIEASAVQVFAHNQLVLILPADNPAEIQSMADLAKEGILLVLSAKSTPIRVYTDAMLQSHDDEFGTDFSDSVLRNLVSEESNVRQVVTRVALGEADAGIVYRTDASGDLGEQLLTIEIDERHNQLASYLIAPLADSGQSAAANRFIDFILSQDGRVILMDYGFCSPAILDEFLPTDPTPEPTRVLTDEPEAEAVNCDEQITETG